MKLLLVRVSIACALALGLPAKAQVIYVDVNPDSCICVGGTNSLSTSWDLDMDGVLDYSISVSSMSGSGGSNYTELISLASNSVACNGSGISSLSAGDSINTQVFGVCSQLESRTFSGYSGNWNSGQDRFAAIKFYSGSTVYYGWLRLTVFVATAGAQVIFKDYAYSVSSITAGEGDPNGIVIQTQNEKAKVFPNPVTGLSRIITDRISAGRTLLIYNEYGVLLKEKSYSPDQEITIGREEFTPGLYFYQVIAAPRVISRGKFIIK